MLSKQKQSVLRNQLFRHLDGIVIAPIAFALDQEGVTKFILDHRKIGLSELTKHFNANEGYLNVALRALCSQGWLTQEVNNEKDEVMYYINESSEIAFDHFYMYKDVVELMKISENYSNRIFEIEYF